MTATLHGARLSGLQLARDGHNPAVSDGAATADTATAAVDISALADAEFERVWDAMTPEQRHELGASGFSRIRRLRPWVDSSIERLRFGAGEKKRSHVPNASGLADDADHCTIAEHFRDAIAADAGHPPVSAFGQLWHVESGVWRPATLDQIAVDIGRRYKGYRFCRRAADYKGIAQFLPALCADDEFFNDAPVGVAAGSQFWRVTDGQVVPEPLIADHRQVLCLRAEPDFHAEPLLWNRLLDHAFAGDTEQRDLLQMLFGAALARSLWLHRIAVLLLGKTTTGKTTLLKVLARLFPRDQVGATNPQNWGKEYFRAALAGKALNLVGELDAKEAIPGGAFKAIVGGDIIEGRHPNHRPFSFVSTAAHFFNANKLPPTVDHTDAFFRRWRIIRFDNIVPEGEIIEALDERIVSEELPAVLAWMLEGAAMLQVRRSIPETRPHKHEIEKWRAANNSVLSFVADAAWCDLDATAQSRGLELYETYRRWSADAGVVRPFGRNGFYEELAKNAGRLRIKRIDHAGVTIFEGVRLRVR